MVARTGQPFHVPHYFIPVIPSSPSFIFFCLFSSSSLLLPHPILSSPKNYTFLLPDLHHYNQYFYPPLLFYSDMIFLSFFLSSSGFLSPFPTFFTPKALISRCGFSRIPRNTLVFFFFSLRLNLFWSLGRGRGGERREEVGGK